MPEKKKGLAKAKRQKTERYFDFTLLFIVLLLVCFGLVMIYSTSSYSAQLSYGNSYHFFTRQAQIAGLGIVMAVIISRFDYHIWARFAFFGYIVSILLQILVFIIGTETNGQSRWIYITPTLGFQPSEFAKLMLIYFLAYIASLSVKSLRTFQGIIKIFAITLPLIGLVTYSNMSTGIILLGITFVIVFVGSNKYWPFAAVIGAGAAFMGVFLMTAGYRVGRINAWLNVETDPNGYQTRQSLYAIGSGGLFGKGLGQSIQKLNYIPEAHNDMIFSIICEELGLFGAICVILLFVLLLWRFMIIANNAPDLFGSLIVVGVMAQIGLQVIINIAVATNSMPNTGIPLPFISYGGTSVIFLLCEIGLVLAVSRQIRFTR